MSLIRGVCGLGFVRVTFTYLVVWVTVGEMVRYQVTELSEVACGCY